MDWEPSEIPSYDILWTDPPWEQRMVRCFETMMKNACGTAPKHSIEEIIWQLWKLAKTDKPMVVEYSIRWHEKIVAILRACGHRFIKSYEREHEYGKQLFLVFNEPVEIAEGKGKVIITETLRKTPYQIVFDCFAGIGYTASAVRKAWRIYIWSEINPKRYSKLLTINI